MIGNGHHIKLGRAPGLPTGLDESFEDDFDIADSNFPSVIAWLNGLTRQAIEGADLRPRFLPQEASDAQLRALTECVVSLAVRGPMNREACVSSAERFRGPLSSSERNTIIGLNMRQSQRLIADSIGCHAKFAVLFSTEKEFIYGDGFFHNLKAVVTTPHAPKILAPITPSVSVIVNRPTIFNVEPRLVTLVLSGDEVERCNHAIQVYSSDALYYRNDRPLPDQAFKCGTHLQYSSATNPIDTLLNALLAI